MKEAKFNTEIVNSIKDAGWFAHKLTDMPKIPGRLRFIGEKPCDILACVHGTMVGIESKQIKKFEGFSLRFLRENQIESLDQIQKAGGQAFVFLNVRIPHVKGVSKRENRLIVINWATWDRELIPVKDIKTMAHVEGKLDRFELDSFFSGVWADASIRGQRK